MEKIAILTRKEYRNTGIETFESNTVPWLNNNLKNCELIELEPTTWYPLSVTVHKLASGRKIRRKADCFDKLFIPTQGRVMFDPRETEAEVIPYIHDILPSTSMYKKYKKGSLADRLSGYPSTLIATRYTKFIAHCDKAICASQQTKRDLIERTGFTGDVEVVYQGIDDMPEPKGKEERDIDLLYVGSLVNRKNPRFLRKTLSRAEEKGYKVATVNHEELELPGKNHTNITDNELAELYSRSRFYLHPSLAEGFGRTPVEAQRYGSIPIGLDTPINREILGEPKSEESNEGSWFISQTPENVIELLEYDEKHVVEKIRQNAVENSKSFKWKNTRIQLKEILDDC